MSNQYFTTKRKRVLTEEQITEIRNSPKDVSLRSLAFRFGVNHKTIHYWRTELNRKEAIIKNTITKINWRKRTGLR